MKTSTFTVVLLLLTGFVYAQQTYVPDDNFEHYLETHDANGNYLFSAGNPNSLGNGIDYDNYVTTSKIDTLTNLNISNHQISDLTGIEDFVALKVLDCSQNNLPNIHLSSNTALEELDCSNNLFPSQTSSFIDVSSNPNLRVLDCSECNLLFLDLSQNTALEELDCSYNTLSNLDLSQNIALKNLNCSNNYMSNLDLSQNINLEILDFSLISSGIANPLTSIDLSHNTALLELHCDRNMLNNLDLSHNTALEKLYLFWNPELTSLDISQNPNLQILNFRRNDRITTLDLSHNTALQTVICNDNNQLSTLITQNPALQVLQCNENQLTALDVSQNTALEELECKMNQITDQLDLSQNTALTKLDCSQNNLTEINLHNGNNQNLTMVSIWGNPNLTCVEVDDPAYMSSHWGSTYPYSVHCPMDEVYVPDDNFENYLETHDANGNPVNIGASNSLGNGVVDDDYAYGPRISTVINLDISSLNIADLTGIENFTSLLVLDCQDNQLTDLNISMNTALQNLNCNNNQITALDISQNIALQTLDCSNNQITGLDATQNIVLQEIDCSSNQLTGLNIRNNNNTNLTVFNAINNPDLLCVEVDDPAYMNTNWSNAIDATATYATHCPLWETYVPDDNFEYYLETHNENGYTVPVGDPNSLGNGVINDNSVTTSKINTVTVLNVYNKNIADLTGIEAFTSLQELICAQNQLTSLDLSQNSALQYLDCSGNQLTSLNLSQNVNLQELYCGYNQLVDLNVTGCPVLEKLKCQGNQLTTIDLTHNPNLYHLAFVDNSVTHLDLSQNTALQILYCEFNQLTTLDLSSNVALTEIWGGDNQFVSLDLSHNVALQKIYLYRNQLSYLDIRNGHNYEIDAIEVWNNPDLICIFVDDANYMDFNFNYPSIDNTQHYVETQADCDALSVNNLAFEDIINIYPVPANETLNIESQITGEYEIYDYSGKLLQQGNIEKAVNAIQIGEFSEGVYLIKITSGEKSFAKKFTIEK